MIVRHGGTPNLSDEVRALPNAEFLAPWFHEQLHRTMPRKIYGRMSAHGQLICRFIVKEEEEEGEEEERGVSKSGNYYRTDQSPFGQAATINNALKGEAAPPKL